MNNFWKDIWDSRTSEADSSDTLEKLIRLDGYDHQSGRITPSDWENYADFISKQLGVKKTYSIYEVGCGSGAFLYPFWKKGCLVGGIDYSEVLLAVARKVISGEFICGEAQDFPTDPRYDFVVSNGVFHYFPDFDYAGKVLKRMIAKAKRAVAVLDVPDRAYEQQAEDARRGKLPPQEYDRKSLVINFIY